MDSEYIPDYYQIDSSNYMKNYHTKGIEWAEIREENNMADGNELHFISRNLDAYYRYSQAKLQVEFQVTDNAGAALAVNGTQLPRVAPVCDAWKALFRRGDLRLGEKGNKTAEVDNIGMIHYIYSLANYSKEYAESIGSQYLFDVDTASDQHVTATVNDGGSSIGDIADQTVVTETGMYRPILKRYKNNSGADATLGTNGFIVENVYDNPNYNEGFKKRVDKSINLAADGTGALRTQTVYLPLAEVFPFLMDYDRVMRGCKLELHLWRDKNFASVLFGNTAQLAAAGQAAQIRIIRVSLWVPRYYPSLSLEKSLTSALASNKKITVKYRHHHLYTQNYAEGINTDHSYNQLLSAYRPLKIYIAMQYQNRNTTRGVNSGQFDLVVQSIDIDINQKKYPYRPYEITYTGNAGAVQVFNYQRVVDDLHRATGKMFDIEDSSIITYENWPTLFPIFVFDLENFEDRLFETNANITVNFRTNSAPANPGDAFTMYMLVESEREASISYADNKFTIDTL